MEVHPGVGVGGVGSGGGEGGEKSNDFTIDRNIIVFEMTENKEEKSLSAKEREEETVRSEVQASLGMPGGSWKRPPKCAPTLKLATMRFLLQCLHSLSNG